MREVLTSRYFTIALTLLAFWIGVKLQKKTRKAVCSPVLIATVLLVGVLLLLRISYEEYNAGGAVISLFLAPATACLAVSIYTRLKLLRENWLPVLAGCAAGSLSSMGSIYLMCRLFRLEEAVTAALLPKSVTTPIAVSVAESLGGIPSITVVAVLITGILGSVLAPTLIKLLRIRDPVEAGLAIGACSHALGTSKALEIGETEGAMSGLAIGVCGILTVIFCLILA